MVSSTLARLLAVCSLKAQVWDGTSSEGEQFNTGHILSPSTVNNLGLLYQLLLLSYPVYQSWRNT